MDAVKLLADTLAEIERRYRLFIVIKDMYGILRISGKFEILFERFNSHRSKYCDFIKNNGSARTECMRFGNFEAGKRMNSEPMKFHDGCFFTCPFGVREFYYPIYCSGHIIGAVVIGSFPTETPDGFRSCVSEFTKKFSIPQIDAENNYSEHLAHIELPTDDGWKREVALCGEMISLICSDTMPDIDVERLFFDDSANVYLDHLLRQRFNIFDDSGKNEHMSIIFNAVYYILDNYSQPLLVDDIAAYCYTSTSTLSHIFAKYYGMTLGDLIRNVRVDRAKLLLTSSSLSVGQIAQSCGFSSTDYFTTVFKKQTGETPKSYRAKYIENKGVL